jgi:hypothetical protein
MTETEPIPNPVVGDSERAAGKSKMRKGLLKPNTEPPPNRTYETANCCPAMFRMSRIGDLAGTVADLWWSEDSGRFVSWNAKLKNSEIVICSSFLLTVQTDLASIDSRDIDAELGAFMTPE